MSGGEKVTVKQLRRLIETQNYRCHLSGRHLEPEIASADHKTPVSRGGLSTIGNICIVHRDINQAKGTQTVEEFIAMCREVVAWADRNEAIPDE
jgi:CRISPR/Cas system Type II protein with McrA/HNH and RuvC-like nuclease domain